ncbi:GAF domain-containing protein [Phototrophicus methaneseepsis]|uniref:GAF domain-containing protein n=1 Tax=Phototrophicus methaneseepsis TaxID=2710758 RepID=A0A7S8EAN8_9CHLR|nr:GAF domain-containing protein [Phototrophicus methaneseepsis]QPC83333.1 GAF domain-containing protein [Phototrophicus methaneseepsis]
MNSNEQKIDQLRLLAEKFLTEHKVSERDVTSTKLMTLLHELQVYHVELQIQNKELQLAHQALEASQQEYSDLFEYAPVSYFVVNSDGFIKQANLTAVKKFGRERQSLYQMHVAELASPHERDKVFLYHRNLSKVRVPQQLEAWFEAVGTASFYGCMESVAIETGKYERSFRIAVTDITERKNYENRIQSLFQLDQAILSGRSVSDVITVAIDSLVEITPYDYAGVVLFHEQAGEATHYHSTFTKEREFYHDKESLAAFKDLTSLQADDYRTVDKPDFLPEFMVRLYPAHLFVPIIQEDVLKGVIDFGAATIDDFQLDQINVAQQIALELGIAIYQAELAEQVQLYADSLKELVEERTVQLEESQLRESDQRLFAEVMLSMVKQINQSLDLQSVMENMLTTLKRIISYDDAEIVIMEDNQIDMVIHYKEAASPQFEDLIPNVAIDNYPIYAEIKKRGKSILINDVPHSRSPVTRGLSDETYAYLGVPIYADNDILGVINVSRFESGSFSQHDLEHLEAFAEHASVAIKNARLYQKAQELAALEERQRLARDLHDAVSQLIFSLSITSESLVRMVERGQLNKVKELSEIVRASAASVHTEMNMLLLELHPIGLSKIELRDLLTQLVNSILTRYSSLDIQLMVKRLPALPIGPKNAIFRVVQEALNNVVKHARAHHVKIMLWAKEGHIYVLVEDDGEGFNLQTHPQQNGLHIMRERATEIGAEISIESEVGNGTRIHMTFPTAFPRL